MGTEVPKQYLPLAGHTVIEHTLNRLLAHPRIAGVVAVVGARDERWDALTLRSEKPLLRAIGGPERCDSVLNGLKVVERHGGPLDWVLVHDAARPCLRATDIDALINGLAEDAVGGLLAVPVCDTIKRSDSATRVRNTVDRADLWHALTPQMFRVGPLMRAIEAATRRGIRITDECSAVEAAGYSPRLVMGRADNIKITRPEDLALAEFYLRRQQD
jgi:2-C-methyl-D-erythritol 4-phosphate cytidylyltransferase